METLHGNWRRKEVILESRHLTRQSSSVTLFLIPVLFVKNIVDTVQKCVEISFAESYSKSSQINSHQIYSVKSKKSWGGGGPHL